MEGLKCGLEVGQISVRFDDSEHLFQVPKVFNGYLKYELIKPLKLRLLQSDCSAIWPTSNPHWIQLTCFEVGPETRFANLISAANL